jgi:hypothetical protein
VEISSCLMFTGLREESQCVLGIVSVDSEPSRDRRTIDKIRTDFPLILAEDSG